MNISSIAVVSFQSFIIYNSLHHDTLKPASLARHPSESYLDAMDQEPSYDRLDLGGARQHLSELGRRQFIVCRWYSALVGYQSND